MGIHKKTSTQKTKRPGSARRPNPRLRSAEKTVSPSKTAKHSQTPLLLAYQHVHELIIQKSHLKNCFKLLCAQLNQDRDYFYSWVALYAEAQQHFYHFASAGLGPSAKTLTRQFEKHEYPPCTQLLKEKKPLIIKNPLQHCSPCPLALKKNNHEVYFVPLLYQDLLYGVLAVSAPAGLPYAPEELQFLQSTAALLAFALHKKHLDQLCVENESSLQISQEKIHSLFKNMAEGIATFDVLYNPPGHASDYILRDANNAYCHHLGIPLAELQNQQSNFFLQRGIPPHLDTFLKVAESGNAVSFESHFERLHKHFFLSVFSPQKGSFILILNDITEKKKLETTLLENEARLRLALEAANQGFWEWQQKTGLIQVSPAFYTLLGTTPPPDACLTLEALDKFVHPKDKDNAFTLFLRHAQKKSDNFEFELRVQNQKGYWHWLLIRGKIIVLDSNNNPVRITGTYLNISARKQSDLFQQFQKNWILDTGSLSDFDKLFQVSIEEVLNITGIDSGGIYLLDDKKGFKLITHYGLSPEFIQALFYLEPTSPRSVNIKKGRPIYTTFSQLDTSEALKKENLKATAIIPFSVNESVIGCIMLASHFSDSFPQHLQETLESYAVFIKNILLRIQTQNKLSESEERYRSIFEQSPIGIALFSAEGDYISINQAGLDIFGISDLSQIKKTNLFEAPTLNYHDKATLLSGKPIRDTFVFDSKQIEAYVIGHSIKTGRIYLESQIIPLGASSGTEPTGYLVQLRDITERRLHEEELRKSETRMDMALWGSATAFWDIMLQTGEMYFDPRWLEMLEYQSTDLVPNIGTWQKLIHPDDLPRVMDTLNAHFAGKRPYFEAEYRMPNKSGSWKWFMDRGKVVERDAHGKPVRISGTHLDITQRKQTENSLHIEQNKAQTFLAVAKFIVVAIDRDQKVLFINPKGCEVLGYAEQEILGHNWFDLCLPADVHEQVKSLFNQLIQGLMPNLEYYENEILNKNGERRWVAWHNSLLKDQEGVIYATLSSGEDITEKRAAQDKIKQSETRMLLTLQSANAGMLDLDIPNDVLHLDATYCRILELPVPELTCERSDFWKFIHPDELAHNQALMQDHLEKKTPFYESELRFLTPSGKEKWVHARCQVVSRAANGKPLRLVGIGMDITQRKEDEQLLQKHRERIELALNSAGLALLDFDIPNDIILLETAGAVTTFTHAGFWKSIHPDDLALNQTLMQNHLDGKTPYYESELRFLTPTGVEKWVHARCRVVNRSATGKPLRLTGIGLDVTQRKENEKLLQEHRERIELALDGADLAMLDWDLLNDRIYCDHRWTQMMGFPQPELTLTRKEWGQLVHPDDLPITQQALQHHLDGYSDRYTFELRLRTYRGDYRWISASGRVTKRDADGTPLRMSGTNLDITVRKQAEVALQQSNQRFRVLFENAADGVLVADPQTKTFLLANQAMCEMLGYTQEELIGAPLSKIHPVAALPEVTKTFELQARGELPRANAIPVLAKNGQVFFADINTTLLTLDGRSCLVGFFRDITEQKIAQDLLQDSIKRFESIIENTPEIAIQGFDESGIICHWNPACENIYGYKKEAVLGRHFRDTLLPGELGDEFDAVLKQIFSTGQAIEPKEWECINKDGRKRWVYSSTFPIFENRKVSEVFCMDIDITSRKEAEEEILQAKERAEETNVELEQAIENANDLARQAAIADAAKSQFLANVSHEIRTPMNSIIGFAEMLLDSELSVEQRNSVETVLHSTETLMTLMNDILDLSKVEAGQMELEKIPMNLESIVLDVCELARGKIGKKSIEMLCDFGTCPTQVMGDPNRLRQVLINLLGNAVKFTKSGEIVTTLTLLAENDKLAHIQCAIRDTGIGIPQDKIQKVFEPFTQADGSTSRVFGGTGLGLPISQKLIHLMGGELTVQTRVNEGSIFSFDLWLEKPKQKEVSPVSPEKDSPLKGLQVLAIDDNPTALGILKYLVVQLGMTCTTLPSFEQGLQQLSAAKYDVVLVDLHLPDLDVALLRTKAVPCQPDKQVQVIALSTFPFRENQTDQYSYFDGVLAKPVSKNSLLHLIRPLLSPEATEAAVQKLFFPSDNKPASVKILLAEDNRSNQEIMLKILERMGHRADVASDGQEVLQLAEKNKYDLIFMDMQMPKMGGLEATYMLRQKGFQVPIIALTANAMKGDRERCLTAGMNDYICKPIKRDAILDILHRYAGIIPVSESPETLRILLVGKEDAYIRSIYDAFHQAFPMASCRITSSGIESSILMGSFFPDLFIIDLNVPDVNTFALINFIKSENRYAHTRIIAYNGQTLDKIHMQTLRHMGIAVLLHPKVYVQKFITLAQQLLTNAYSFHISETESDLSLVEAISHELGITTKDYYDILEIFLKNTPEKIRLLKTALDEENASRAGDISHSIKSSSLSLRLHTLADPASRLEKLAEANKFQEMDTHFATLQNAFEAIRLTMKPAKPNQANDSTPPLPEE